MQIRPITPVSYKNQNVQQNNNQPSFGMATTQAMKDFWVANRKRLLTSPYYTAQQTVNILESLVKIEQHSSTLVDYKGATLIVLKEGKGTKRIPVESLAAIEEAAKEL